VDYGSVYASRVDDIQVDRVGAHTSKFKSPIWSLLDSMIQNPPVDEDGHTVLSAEVKAELQKINAVLIQYETTSDVAYKVWCYLFFVSLALSTFCWFCFVSIAHTVQ
jgi:hypothetical protein